MSFMYDGVNLDSWSDGARGGRLLSFHNGLKLKLFPRCFPAVSGGYRVL